jgi:hypothetical protein
LILDTTPEWQCDDDASLLNGATMIKVRLFRRKPGGPRYCNKVPNSAFNVERTRARA